MAIVRLDKIRKNGHLESIKNTVDMLNGTLWVLGGLASGESEVCNVSAASGSNVAGFDPIVLHANPEYEYTGLKPGLKDYVTTAGNVGRAYHLHVGDVITVTGDLFDSGGVPAVGDLVGPSIRANSAGKYSKADTAGKVTDGTTPVEPNLLFRCIEVTTLGYDDTTAYSLKVVKNNR